jgi:hypothetical protein
VIRNDLDAKTLAVLWALRKAWLPLFWIGSSIAIVYFIIIHDAEAFDNRFAEIADRGRSSARSGPPSPWSPSPWG